MKSPEELVEEFKSHYDEKLTKIFIEQGWIEKKEDFFAQRFLSRSIAPHVMTLSNLFNRIEGQGGLSDNHYYSDTQNAKNRRLAYFLSFFPGNAFRVGAVWAELKRLGFQFSDSKPPHRVIELGAGLGAGTFGVMAAELSQNTGFHPQTEWHLVEQSKTTLQMGETFLREYFQKPMRSHHQKINLTERWVPKSFPKFNVLLTSFFLNESGLDPLDWTHGFWPTFDHHIEDEGLMIFVEPALRTESRRLLTFRKHLIEQNQKRKRPFQILTPCMGAQACGALTKETDWCHEEVSWWRPKTLMKLDEVTGLDRKTLPFSFFVIAKSERPLTEILPHLSGPAIERARIISPVERLSPNAIEFFGCSEDGKFRARAKHPKKGPALDRGDLLEAVQKHGNPELVQLDQFKIVD